MNSPDVRIVIGGQEYIIDGNTMKPASSTFQDEVLSRLDKLDKRMDKFDVRMDKLDVRMDKLDVRMDGIESRLTRIEQEQSDIRTEQKYQREALQIIGTTQAITTQKVDDMQTSIYWGVALIGLFITGIAALPTFREWFKVERREAVDVEAIARRAAEILQQKPIV